MTSETKVIFRSGAVVSIVLISEFHNKIVLVSWRNSDGLVIILLSRDDAFLKWNTMS